MLELKNLQLGYGKKTINRSLNIVFQPKYFHSILGRNGSGKSTLIKTIARLIPALKGEILYQSKPLNMWNTDEFTKKIGFVFTNYSTEQEIKVYDFISYGRAPYTNWKHDLKTIDKEIIAKTIEKTSISKLIDKNITELSDGQKQRVLIARALVQDTECLILDEPTSFLDFYEKKRIFNLLKKISEEKTVIISTHEWDYAFEYSDKILLFNQEDYVFDFPKNISK